LGIENCLHWVLDVVFHDDLARPRTGFGPANMAVVKHIAMNLVRAANDKHSLKGRRKRQISMPVSRSVDPAIGEINLRRFPGGRMRNLVAARSPRNHASHLTARDLRPDFCESGGDCTRS
jgi:hypothetical protein